MQHKQIGANLDKIIDKILYNINIGMIIFYNLG